MSSFSVEDASFSDDFDIDAKTEVPEDEDETKEVETREPKPQEPNVIDVLLMSTTYVILLSGLPQSPIKTVAEELVQSLSPYAISLDFMHLEIGNDSKIVVDRLKDLTKEKKRIIIVQAQTYNPSISLPKGSMSTHINISMSDKMINNEQLAKTYKEEMAKSKARYFNFKPDTEINVFIDNIFEYIIDSIEKIVYKNEYEKLNHKTFV